MRVPQLLMCLLLASAALSAQVPGGDALPVTALPADEAAPPIRFVALARERGAVPRRDWQDMQATIWDVPIGRPAARRVVMGKSPWNAAPLLQSATLLRWQVPAAGGGGRGYTVRLLGVDYTTFALTEHLQARQAQALGRSGDLVYLATSDGQRVLDLRARSVAALEPELAVLAQHGDDWLVAVAGRLARFDAGQGEVVRRYDAIEIAAGFGAGGHVDWDGGRFAVQRGRFVDAGGEPVQALLMGEWRSVHRELRVWDLGEGVESKVAVRTSATGGAGVPIIPMEMRTELVGGLFRYTECRPATVDNPDPKRLDWARDVEWVTIDVATGEELLRRPYAPRSSDRPDPLAVHRVPAWLREHLEDALAFDPVDDVAAAFLAFHDLRVGASPDRARRFDGACRTPDGEQLLVLDEGTFYHCDLATQELVRWAAPAALQGAIVELHAVPLR